MDIENLQREVKNKQGCLKVECTPDQALNWLIHKNQTKKRGGFWLISDQKRNQILKLYNQGYSKLQIKKICRCSQHTINKVVGV